MNGLLAADGRLQRVAQLMAGVMHKHVVQRRALHGKRSHRDVRIARGFQQFHRRARAVVGGDAEDVFVGFHLGHIRQRLQSFHPVWRRVGKTDFQNVFAGNGGLQFQRRIQRDEFPWSTMAMRSHSLSASSM